MSVEHRKRVAVVTGATGGIGRFIARGLARAGHHVVLVGRDPARTKAAETFVRSECPGASTEGRIADLAELRAVARLGRALAADHPAIGVLVNNAGMFGTRPQRTAEGLDAVLAVNHLAPHLLADLLEPSLRAGAPARIVNVGSSVADRGRLDPDRLELGRDWGMVRAYRDAKLALLTDSFARAERLRGTGVVVNVVHPGLVATGLIRAGGPVGVAWRLLARVARTEAEGAEPPLHVALAPDWASITGRYCKNREGARPNKRALDRAMQTRLDHATRRLIARTLGDGADPPG